MSPDHCWPAEENRDDWRRCRLERCLVDAIFAVTLNPGLAVSHPRERVHACATGSANSFLVLTADEEGADQRQLLRASVINGNPVSGGLFQSDPEPAFSQGIHVDLSVGCIDRSWGKLVHGPVQNHVFAQSYYTQVLSH